MSSIEPAPLPEFADDAPEYRARLADLFPPPLPRRRRREVRRAVRRTGFSGRLSHELVVPAGADGRPGERVLTPSRPLFPPVLASDGSRDDFCVLVGRARSAVAAVCLGPVDVRGDALASAHATIENLSAEGFRTVQAPRADPIGVLDAVHYRMRRRRSELDEWRFSHDGWLFVATLNRRYDDLEFPTLTLTRRMLGTWRWLSADGQTES